MEDFRVTMTDKPLNELSDDEIRDIVKKTKDTRDKMGGALYWNVLNEELNNLKKYCLNKGISLSKKIIS